MLRSVTLAVDYQNLGGPAPRLVDIRLEAASTATLVDVRAGDAVARSGKALYVDDVTGLPWHERKDGTYQVLIYRGANTDPLESGRLLTATFQLASVAPIKFSLVRRLQIFAPGEADGPLQATDYDRPVWVGP